MKKLFTISIALLLMLTMCACGAKKTQEQDTSATDDSTAMPDIIQSYELLTESGWEAADGSFKKIESNDDCNACYILTPDGNDVTIELHYDYGAQDKEVQQLYKKDDTIAPGVASGWISEIYTITGADIKNVNYEVYVGNKNVGSGSMELSEALRLAMEYDD